MASLYRGSGRDDQEDAVINKPAIQFTIIEERRPGQRPRHHIRLTWPTTYDSRREAEAAYDELIADVRRPAQERVNVLEAELHAARAAMRGMVTHLVHDTVVTGLEARAIEAERGRSMAQQRTAVSIADLEHARNHVSILSAELDTVDRERSQLGEQLEEALRERDALRAQLEAVREADASALIQGLRAEVEQVRADCRRRLALLRKG